MAEWSKAAVSKIAVGATSPRVQIPLFPPFFLPKKWRNEAVRLCFMARNAASCSVSCASYFAALPQNAS